MASLRTYGDGCGIAYALDLVGERWALLIVRELLLGPKRFTDLQIGLPHASRSVLAQRLRELEQAGLVRRRRLPPPAASTVYELSEWGQELENVVMSLGRFALRGPVRPRPDEMSVDSHVLKLNALFDQDAAQGLDASYELRLGEDRFRVDVDDGQLVTSRGTPPQPDATIETDPKTLIAVLSGGRQPTEALRSGAIKIEGSKAASARFLGLFHRPEPATAVPVP